MSEEPSTPAVPNPSGGSVAGGPAPGITLQRVPSGRSGAATALSGGLVPPLSPAQVSGRSPVAEPLGVGLSQIGTRTPNADDPLQPPARQGSNLSKRSRPSEPALAAAEDAAPVPSRKGSAAAMLAADRRGSVRSQQSAGRVSQLGQSVLSGSALSPVAQQVSQAILAAGDEPELLRQSSGAALSRHASRLSGLGGTPPEPVLEPPPANEMEPAPVEHILPPEEELPYLRERLVERDRRVNSLEQQVEALQRLHAASSMDNTVKVINEERTRLAARLKDANKELDRLRAANREKDLEISRLSKSQASGDKGVARTNSSSLRKDLQASSQRESAALAKSSDLQQQVMQLQRDLRLSRQETEGLAAEKDQLNEKLEQAHSAIIASTQRGHLNEVKLHQARTALHMVVRELGAAAVQQVPELLEFQSGVGSAAPPGGDPRSCTPAADRRACHFHYSPRRHEQISSVRRDRPSDGIWRSDED
eukprot:Hpha_TRINITY_DN14455_c0_g1::TRINITY_DN14455_c0_g1_i1::g.158026::m.158026